MSSSLPYVAFLVVFFAIAGERVADGRAISLDVRDFSERRPDDTSVLKLAFSPREVVQERLDRWQCIHIVPDEREALASLEKKLEGGDVHMTILEKIYDDLARRLQEAKDKTASRKRSLEEMSKKCDAHKDGSAKLFRRV